MNHLQIINCLLLEMSGVRMIYPLLLRMATFSAAVLKLIKHGLLENHPEISRGYSPLDILFID